MAPHFGDYRDGCQDQRFWAYSGGRAPWPADCESVECAGKAQAGAARNRDDLGSTGAFASSPSVEWREQVKALCFCLRAENTLLVDAGCHVLLDCQRYD